jgi:hypothetical protein
MEPSFGAACWSWVAAAGWLRWLDLGGLSVGDMRQGGWPSAVPGVLGGIDGASRLDAVVPG